MIFAAVLSVYQSWFIYSFFRTTSSNTVAVGAAALVALVAIFSLTSLSGLCAKHRDLDLYDRSTQRLSPVLPMLLATLWVVHALQRGSLMSTDALFQFVPIIVLASIAVTIRKRNELEEVILMWVVSAAVFVTFSLLLALILGLPEQMDNGAPRRFILGEELQFHFLRIAGPYGGHAVSGLTALLMILAAIAFMNRTKYLIFLVAGSTLILTESRNAIVAALIGLAIASAPISGQLLSQRARWGRTSGAALLCLISSAILVADPSMNHRIPPVLVVGNSSTYNLTPEVADGPTTNWEPKFMSHVSYLEGWGTWAFGLTAIYVVLILWILARAMQWLMRGDRRPALLMVPMCLAGLVDRDLSVGSVSMLIIGWLLILLWSSARPTSALEIKSKVDSG